MPRIDSHGNLEFHPIELPRDYHSAVDLENPFFNKKKDPEVVTIRMCKKCGEKFTLHGDYDSENVTHDLCDDCIITLPKNPEQRYSAVTIQSGMEAGEVEIE